MKSDHLINTILNVFSFSFRNNINSKQLKQEMHCFNPICFFVVFCWGFFFWHTFDFLETRKASCSHWGCFIFVKHLFIYVLKMSFKTKTVLKKCFHPHRNAETNPKLCSKHTKPACETLSLQTKYIRKQEKVHGACTWSPKCWVETLNTTQRKNQRWIQEQKNKYFTWFATFYSVLHWNTKLSPFILFL